VHSPLSVGPTVKTKMTYNKKKIVPIVVDPDVPDIPVEPSPPKKTKNTRRVGRVGESSASKEYKP